MRVSRLSGRVFVLPVLLALLGAGAQAQTTHHVPGDFNTISLAMQQAALGDTIQVAPGTYTENVTLKAGVNLIAQSPTETILQAEDPLQPVILIAFDTLDDLLSSQISGFKITGGKDGIDVNIVKLGKLLTTQLIIDGNWIDGNTRYGINIHEADVGPQHIIKHLIPDNNIEQYGIQ